MKENDRIFTWKKIANIYHKQKIQCWKYKPKFRIGEVVVVKKTASNIYGDTGDSLWTGLVAGFDGCRKPLRGRQGIVIELQHDKDYGCSYYVQFGSKTGRSLGRKVMMDEQWLRKRMNKEVCEVFITNMIIKQVNDRW